MDVHPHRSQHEAAEQLPLLTESATVTEVAAMDRSRNDAVVAAIVETLDDAGAASWRRVRPASSGARRRWVRDQLDPVDEDASEGTPADGETSANARTPLNEHLPEHARERRAGERLAALQERYLRPYPSLLRVRVEADEPLDFVAGQYVSVRYEETTRPYSVANAPGEDAVEFCIRRVPGGRLTGDLASGLEPGDTVTLRGPYGEFVLAPPSERDLVFLATGTGVAPFRSMIDYCFATGRDRHEGESRDVWLFLGVGWEDDLPYREHFRALARERENFHFVPTLSREEYLTDWDGETAYVQHVLTKYLADDALAGVELPTAFEAYRSAEPRLAIEDRLRPDSVAVYGCGVTAMVNGLADAVERLGVSEEHARFEGFG